MIFVLLAFAVPPLVAQDYGNEKPPAVPEVSVPLTAAEKAALTAVDVRLAGVEALVAKIDDPAYKASVIASLRDLQKRRGTLGRKFDPALYEALMHAVISRYQIVALWLTPPRALPVATKASGTHAAPAAPTPASPPAAAPRKSETKPATQ